MLNLVFETWTTKLSVFKNFNILQINVGNFNQIDRIKCYDYFCIIVGFLDLTWCSKKTY